MSTIYALVIFASAAISLAIALYHSLFRLASTKRFPPGPQGLPLLGNVLQLPSSWSHLSIWAQHRTHWVFFRVFDQNVLILNTVSDSMEILAKRGSIYCERPFLPLAGELMGWKHSIGMMTYSDKLRRCRKHMHQTLNPRALTNYHGALEDQAKLFLQALVSNPTNYASSIKRTAAGAVIKVLYGHSVMSDDDEILLLGYRALDQLEAATLPGTNLVDFFPILTWLPSWMPGAGFKRVAKTGDATRTLLFQTALQTAKASKLNDMHVDSISDHLISREVDEDVIQSVGASIHAAGWDTIVSTLTYFFLAMSLYPEAQRKAHAEIDCVLGSHLPTFADRAQLPYVEALVTELLRWSPAFTMGIPHISTEDDEYRGYSIPKGTMVIPNIRAMAYDPTVYPHPEKFFPDRFLDGSNTLHPQEYVFGFGRRICPGAHYADSAIWIIIASTLSKFEITKRDWQGQASWNMHHTKGMISGPSPFPCNILPRSLKHLEEEGSLGCHAID